MNTRLRVISITAITSVLFFISLLGGIEFAGSLLGYDIPSDWAQIIAVAILAIILLLGTVWVLYFKISRRTIMPIVMFPAATLVPYMLLAEKIIQSIFSNVEQIPTAVIATVIYALLCYLLLLTANVLNGAYLFNIPLGQAGKAAQFVFSLISAYFLFAFLYGGAVSVEIRFLIAGMAAYYWSYASLWNLQLPPIQLNTSAFAISVVITLLVIALSLWPLEGIYATLSTTVVLYILLNVGLEQREHMERSLWLEYMGLMVLVCVILATLAEWGINGTLI